MFRQKFPNSQNEQKTWQRIHHKNEKKKMHLISVMECFFICNGLKHGDKIICIEFIWSEQHTKLSM